MVLLRPHDAPVSNHDGPPSPWPRVAGCSSRLSCARPRDGSDGVATGIGSPVGQLRTTAAARAAALHKCSVSCVRAAMAGTLPLTAAAARRRGRWRHQQLQ